MENPLISCKMVLPAVLPDQLRSFFAGRYCVPIAIAREFARYELNRNVKAGDERCSKQLNYYKKSTVGRDY